MMYRRTAWIMYRLKSNVSSLTWNIIYIVVFILKNGIEIFKNNLLPINGDFYYVRLHVVKFLNNT